MLTEANIIYTHDQGKIRDSGMIPFQYTRLHRPSGFTDTVTCYILRFHNGLELLNRWNQQTSHGGWVYYK